MPLAFGHDHLASLPAAEHLPGGADDRGVGVDLGVGAVGLDEVRLEQDRLALEGGRAEAQFLQAVAQNLLEIPCVRGGLGDEDIGAEGGLVVVASQLERQSGGRRGPYSRQEGASSHERGSLETKGSSPWASSSRLSPVMTSRRPVYSAYDSLSQSAAAAGLAFQARRPSTPQAREMGARTSGSVRSR